MNWDDRFIDSDVHAGAPMYRCMTCGAVVEDTTSHEEWHNQIEKLTELMADTRERCHLEW